MRIGRFGERNELSIDTIRHYMDLGLIVPEKKGGQYDFDERCQQDVERILELKGMGFSLQEIKTIFFYRNLGQFMNYEEDSYYQSIFRDQYEKLEREIKSLTEIKERLKLRLDRLSDKSASPQAVIGVDMRMIDMLQCLQCGEQLTLQAGSIIRNQIVDGKLTCDCGAEYFIESGILQAGEPYHSESGLPPGEHLHEYIQETDKIYLENVHRGLHWSKRKLEQMDLRNKVLLELGTGFGFFLRNILQALPEDCLYIAVDRNLERHRFLKHALERTGFSRKILFICSDFRNVPIKKHSVDVLLDHTGTSNYSFEHEEFLLREADSLVKADAYLLGSYLAFRNFSSQSRIPPGLRHNFTLGCIKSKISALHYKTIDERTSEYIDKGGKYEDFFVQGEEIFTYSFFGQR